MMDRAEKRAVGTWPIVVVILTAYAMIQSFCARAGFFAMDDIDELNHILKMTSPWQVLGMDAFSLFRPVKNVLFAIFAWFGEDGIVWSRLLSICIGCLTFFPVRRFFRYIFNSDGWALAAASIWLLAPTQVSCVAWLSCVNIQIMAGFSAAALAAHAERRYAFAVTYYVFALLSYECAISLPGIAFVMDVMFSCERMKKRDTWLSYGGYAVAAISYLVIRVLFSGATSVHGSFPYDVTRPQIIFASARFLQDHLISWVWPFGRMAVNGYFSPWISSPLELALCWLVPVSLLACSALTFRARPRFAFGVVAFFAGYLPVSNILGLGNGPYGEYYLALAGLGLAIAYCDLLAWLLSFPRGSLAWGAGVFIACVRLVGIPEAARYAACWGDSCEAFANSVRTFPNSVNNRMLLLRSYAHEGVWSVVEAGLGAIEVELDAAHERKSDFYLLQGLLAANVRKDPDEALAAMELYKAALPVPPKGYGWYHYFRGCVLEDLKHDFWGAQKEYLKAIEVDPDGKMSAPYYDRLARTFAVSGELEKAIAGWRVALYWDTHCESARRNLEVAEEELSKSKNPEGN